MTTSARKKFTLTVEQGEAGLWYVTSLDIVENASLLVAEHSLEQALSAVPKCMADLERARADKKPDFR